jgi:hypothetical protein
VTLTATGVETWSRYRHRRTEVQAARYDGTEVSRLAIAERVNRHNPDHAQLTPYGDLLIRTQLRWASVPDGFWVGIGYNGRLWVISDEVMVGCYDPTGQDHTADFTLAPGVAAGLAAEARSTTDTERLREIAQILGAACEAVHIT